MKTSIKKILLPALITIMVPTLLLSACGTTNNDAPAPQQERRGSY